MISLFFFRKKSWRKPFWWCLQINRTWNRPWLPQKWQMPLAYQLWRTENGRYSKPLQLKAQGLMKQWNGEYQLCFIHIPNFTLLGFFLIRLDFWIVWCKNSRHEKNDWFTAGSISTEMKWLFSKLDFNLFPRLVEALKSRQWYKTDQCKEVSAIANILLSAVKYVQATDTCK